MEMCSEYHVEIVYNPGFRETCPLCAARARIESLLTEIGELREEVDLLVNDDS